MLNEQQIDCHTVFILFRDIRHTGKEAFLVFLTCQFGLVIAEIHVEGRIGNDIVKLRQTIFLGVQMTRGNQRVIMHYVAQRVDKVIENQIQPQKLVGFGGDILRENSAVILADLVRQSQHQRTGTGSRVIYGDIADIALHHDLRDDICDGMGRIVFGVFAEILVVVLNQILKDLSKEIVLLLKHIGKAELHQLVDDGPAEQRLLGAFNHILRNGVEQTDFFLTAGLHGEDVQIAVCNIHQRIVKQLMERIGTAVCLAHGFVVLMIEQIGDVMRLFQFGRAAAQHHSKHFILIVRHCGQRFLNVFRIGKRRICFLRFIKEFVAEVFIQKNLRDDLILTGRATQAKVGTDGLEIVDHPLGANGDIFNLHYAVHVLSAKYSSEMQVSI